MYWKSGNRPQALKTILKLLDKDPYDYVIRDRCIGWNVDDAAEMKAEGDAASIVQRRYRIRYCKNLIGLMKKQREEEAEKMKKNAEVLLEYMGAKTTRGVRKILRGWRQVRGTVNAPVFGLVGSPHALLKL